MEYLLNIYDTFYSHYSTEDRAKWNERNPAGIQLIYEIEQMIEDA